MLGGALVFAHPTLLIIQDLTLFPSARRTRPDAERPYRVYGYPWRPGLYVLAASTIMIDLLFVKPAYTWPGLLIVLTGVPVYFLWNRRSHNIERERRSWE